VKSAAYLGCNRHRRRRAYHADGSEMKIMWKKAHKPWRGDIRNADELGENSGSSAVKYRYGEE